MKTWNDWENQMPAWTPRRPSARLARRLFGPPQLEAAQRAQLVGRLTWSEAVLRQWAVGLAGCVALLAALHAGENGLAHAHRGDPGPFILLSALSNQQSAAYHSPHAHSEWNHCARPLLEWTNNSRIPSSMPSFSARKTN